MASTSSDQEFFKRNILSEMAALRRRLAALERRTGIVVPSGGGEALTAGGDVALVGSPLGAAVRLYLYDPGNDTWWRLYVTEVNGVERLGIRRIRKQEVV